MRAKLQDVDEGPRSAAPQRRPAPHRAMTRLLRAAKRLFLEVAGWLTLLAGLAAIPLPGPGLLITFAGLLLLSRHYVWAERRVEWVRLRALEGAAQSVATWPRLTVSMVGAGLVLAAGVVWFVSPPAPTWWPLADTWWLPGSAVVGVTQLASAVIALALMGYSYARFRRAPEPLTAVAGQLCCGVCQPIRTTSSVTVTCVAVIHHQSEYLGERREVLCQCPRTEAA